MVLHKSVRDLQSNQQPTFPSITWIRQNMHRLTLTWSLTAFVSRVCMQTFAWISFQHILQHTCTKSFLRLKRYFGLFLQLIPFISIDLSLTPVWITFSSSNRKIQSCIDSLFRHCIICFYPSMLLACCRLQLQLCWLTSSHSVSKS